MKRTSFITLFVVLMFSLTMIVACGTDDDSTDGDTTDGDTIADGDTEAAVDGDTEDNGAVEALMQQADEGCTGYWDTTCSYDFTADDPATTTADFCKAWLDAYAPTMEAFADGMDMECMQTAMGGFFTCMADSCDPDVKWKECDGAVQAGMMGCFSE